MTCGIWDQNAVYNWIVKLGIKIKVYIILAPDKAFLWSTPYSTKDQIRKIEGFRQNYVEICQDTKIIPANFIVHTNW
jgi:hypothetical protein